MILVSACLLGHRCKYNGGHNRSAAVLAYLDGKDCLPICPETMGGLTAPRPPAEIQPDGSVKDRDGLDVTAQFQAGAKAVLELAKMQNPTLVICKANSPSCGCGRVYDGSFTGRTIPGNGIAAQMLLDAGYLVCTEAELSTEEEDR